MKKVIAALAVALLFFACDNGSVENETNPLIGTWDNVNPPLGSELHLGDMPGLSLVFTRRLIITKTEITYYLDKRNPEPNWTNNYTYDEFEIKMYNPKYPDYFGTIKRENYSDEEYLFMEPRTSDLCFKKIR